MALGGEVYDAVNVVVSHNATHRVEISDVGLDKCIVRFVLYVFEVGEIAGVGKFIEVYNPVVGIFVYK